MPCRIADKSSRCQLLKQRGVEFRATLLYRQSYAFALVSVAAGLELKGGVIESAGLALGGVAPKP